MQEKVGEKMQILKKNKKMIIGITIGVVIAVFISTVSCYALAETLINSKDVVYEDNSNLVADNVQDAIDGTCSKIDTRLSDIEDKLYTFTRFSDTVHFTSQTTLFYTGASITFPANSYCGITALAVYEHSKPTAFYLSTSSTQLDSLIEGNKGFTGVGETIFINYNFYTTTARTYYFWASYSGVGSNIIDYAGYCATKYK